jgi:hypothetical protein
MAAGGCGGGAVDKGGELPFAALAKYLSYFSIAVMGCKCLEFKSILLHCCTPRKSEI